MLYFVLSTECYGRHDEIKLYNNNNNNNNYYLMMEYKQIHSITQPLLLSYVILLLCFSSICFWDFDVVTVDDSATSSWMINKASTKIQTTIPSTKPKNGLPINDTEECFALSLYARKGITRLNVTKLMHSNKDYINTFHRMKEISSNAPKTKTSQEYKLFNKIGE
jgi:hypothetical protein